MGKLSVFVASLVPLFAGGCEAVKTEMQTPAAESAEERDWQDELRRLYEAAHERATDVDPREMLRWAREDVERIGDWQYRVVALPDADGAALEATLNELGADRWEVFWVERGDGELVVMLKRPARSYVQKLPLAELQELLRGGN